MKQPLVTQKWDTVAIVGVGLIGGSVGLALRNRGLARRVIGIGRDATRLARAQEVGAITHYETSVAEGAAEADCVIVCTPVETIVSFVGQIAAVCPRGSWITDAGSTKRSIVAELGQQFAGRTASFLGSHPLAGSHQSGVEAASGQLFADRVVVITPTSDTDADLVARVRGFWTALDARVLVMSPDQHDQALAMTSHLPHVVAALLSAATPDDFLPLAASGWKDTTRIAAGAPELWRQILLQNRSEVLRSIGSFERLLNAFRQALESEDYATVQQMLEEGKQRRDALGN